MNKKQQEEQRRQEDLALMQGLLWVAGAVVLEVLLFFINRYAFDFDATMQGVTLAETVRGLLGVMRWAVQAVAAVAVLAVSAAVGSALAYYLIFAMGAWLFALLVYHTVKML